MGYIGAFDQVILNWVEKLPAALHPLMVIITDIGSPFSCAVMLIIAMVITGAYPKTRFNKKLLISEVSLLLAMPLAMILKELIKRVRPDTLYVRDMLFSSYSFPSGHAYSSLLVFGLFAYLANKYLNRAWRRIVPGLLMVLIVLVGLSRIYLGAHYPSDVLGGWVLGFIILFAVMRLKPKLKPHRNR